VAAAGGLRRSGTWRRRGRGAAVPMTSPVLHLSDLLVLVALDLPTPPRHRCRQGAAATPKYCRCSFPCRRSSLASERRSERRGKGRGMLEYK
jgi:hypothetical protein